MESLYIIGGWSRSGAVRRHGIRTHYRMLESLRSVQERSGDLEIPVKSEGIWRVPEVENPDPQIAKTLINHTGKM